MTLWDRIAGRRIEEIVCSVDLEHTFDSLHAHAIPEDVEISPGDQVIVHGLPGHVPLGEKRTMQAVATIRRAGWFDRLYTQFSAIFELTELYHVGFEPQGFTADALKPVEA
jgi:hypothetical protein